MHHRLLVVQTVSRPLTPYLGLLLGCLHASVRRLRRLYRKLQLPHFRVVELLVLAGTFLKLAYTKNGGDIATSRTDTSAFWQNYNNTVQETRPHSTTNPNCPSRITI